MANLALVALAYEPDLDPFNAAHAYQIASSTSRAAAVTAAIQEAVKNKARGVFFSGYTAAIPLLSQVASSPIVNSLRAHNLSGIFEMVEPGIAATGGKGKGAGPGRDYLLARRAFYVVLPNQKMPAGPFHQRVVQSSDATAGRLKTLAGELLRGGIRRQRVAGCDVALLICGESNILYKSRRDDGQTGKRYPGHPDWFDYRLLFNPQHSIWGRFEIDDRLKFLSQHGQDQLAVSCTNYPRGSQHRQRIICVTRGGTPMPSGSGPHPRNDYILQMLDL